MVDTIGLLTIFFTHSAADLQWPELARLICPDDPDSNGVPVDITMAYGRARYRITRSEAKQQVHDRSKKEQPRVQALGRGDRGWVATELRLNY